MGFLDKAKQIGKDAIVHGLGAVNPDIAAWNQEQEDAKRFQQMQADPQAMLDPANSAKFNTPKYQGAFGAANKDQSAQMKEMAQNLLFADTQQALQIAAEMDKRLAKKMPNMATQSPEEGYFYNIIKSTDDNFMKSGSEDPAAQARGRSAALATHPTTARLGVGSSYLAPSQQEELKSGVRVREDMGKKMNQIDPEYVNGATEAERKSVKAKEMGKYDPDVAVARKIYNHIAGLEGGEGEGEGGGKSPTSPLAKVKMDDLMVEYKKSLGKYSEEIDKKGRAKIDSTPLTKAEKDHFFKVIVPHVQKTGKIEFSELPGDAKVSSFIDQFRNK